MTGTSAVGRFRLETRSRFGFPWAQLYNEDGTVAELGRLSALNVFLMRGQRIRLPNGDTWRLKAVPWNQYVCPILLDPRRKRLATSAPGVTDYAINCRDRAFTLIPAERRAGRPRRWELLELDESIATVRRNPYEANVIVPIPLPALLMSFALAAIGVMGENDLKTTTSWASPQY